MLADERERKIIENTISDNRSTLYGREIYVFGCTKYARDIRDFLAINNLSFNGIIDNNKDKIGKECLGISVRSPKEALFPQRDNITVVICSKYSHEMSSQISDMGYLKESILLIDIDEPCSDEMDAIDSSLEIVDKGYELYKELIHNCSSDTKLFLCPYPGTGDIYFECSYLPAYIDQNKIKSYALVVVGNKCRRVCEIFDEKSIFVINQGQMDALLKAWELLGSDKMNVKPILHWGWRCKRYLYADKHPQITFNEMFVYDSFGFNEEPERKLPRRYSNDNEIDSIFTENELVPGKTVVLAPYAGSFVSEMPMSFWEDIVCGLKKKGYTVCTNCFGDKELPVSGTKALALSFGQAISFLNKAGGFIALRSGLCDIVSSSTARQIVLYENGFNATNIRFFGLKQTGLNKSVVEIVYDKSCKAEAIAQFF